MTPAARTPGNDLAALMLAAVACLVVDSEAEVNVVSRSTQTCDQADLRERHDQMASGAYHTVALTDRGTVVARPLERFGRGQRG